MSRIIFSIVKWTLMVIFVGGFFLSMTDEAFKFFRGRYNTKGTIVHGFALYEKILPTHPRSADAMFPDLPFSIRSPGWEYVNFYQNNFECEFWRSREQSDWEHERGRKLRTPLGEKPIWLAGELPLERYRCVPSPMYYRAGQGWGLF